MRRFAPSKYLLLHRVICDDNVANNGGGFVLLQNVGPIFAEKNKMKLIPWEVCLLIKGNKECRELLPALSGVRIF